MLPLLAGLAAGGALQAGIGGLQNYLQGQDKEKEAKRQALDALTSKFQKSNTFTPFNAPPKAPGFAETVVAPMVSAGAQGAIGAAMKPTAPSMPTAPAAGSAQAMQNANDYFATPDYKNMAREKLGGYYGGAF